MVYQHETTGKMEDSYFIKTTYSVYLVNIGAGNKPKFVFCDPSQKVESGESSLYLKPLSEEKVGEIVEDLIKSGGLVDFVEKKARIKIYKKDCSIDDYAEALIKTHSKNPLFFMQTLPLPIEVLNEIPDFYKFAMDALSQGITVDENLVDMYVSKIPEHNASKIKPKTAMPFSDNGVIITNAGVGKTTLANMINYAGFYYGVGIWSPRCKSGGSYGMYKLG